MDRDNGPQRRSVSSRLLRAQTSVLSKTASKVDATKRKSLEATAKAKSRVAGQIEEVWGAVQDDAKRRAFWGPKDWILGTTQGQCIFLLGIAISLVSLGMVAWIGVGGSAGAGADTSLEQSFWISWGLFFDPGTQTGIPADDPWEVKIMAMSLSLSGFIFNLAFLGLIVAQVRTRLDRWKKTYSRVVASDHILILGWGDKTLFLLHELLEARNNERQAKVAFCMRLFAWCRPGRKFVILAERPVLQMAEEVRMHFHFLLEGRQQVQDIMYREGDPTSRTELMKVSAKSAHTLLISSGSEGLKKADEGVIQTLLAIAALPERIRGHVIAEMQSVEGLNVVNQLVPDAKGIFARQTVNRMLILRAMVPTVGFTYLDFASFQRGNELYVVPVRKQLFGKTLQEAACMYVKSIPMAVLPKTKRTTLSSWSGSWTHVQEHSAGAVVLDPERRLEDGDQLVVLALTLEDSRHCDLTARLGKVEAEAPAHAKIEEVWQRDGQLLLGTQTQKPMNLAIVGCPTDFANFLQIVNMYVAPGSDVYLLSERSVPWREAALRRYFGPSFKDASRVYGRFRLHHHIGSATSAVDIRGLPLEELDCVMILSDSDGCERPIAADSRNLTTAITIRTVQGELRRAGKKMKDKCKVLTELLDPKSQQVVEGNVNVRKTGSFVYSNALETGLLAMAASDPTVYAILMCLMDPKSGVGHIVAVPVKSLVEGTEHLSYFDLNARVFGACGGILLGWRRMGDRHPILNPTNKHQALEWSQAGKDELSIFMPDSRGRLVAQATGWEQPVALDADAVRGMSDDSLEVASPSGEHPASPTGPDATSP